MSTSKSRVLKAAQADFEKEYPDEKILVCEFAKAIRTKEDAVEMADYVSSQNCAVLLSNQRIKANQWSIALSDVEKASLVKHTGRLFRKRFSLVIRLRNQPVQYQFDVRDEKSWQGQPALKVHYYQAEKGSYRLLIILAVIIIGLVVAMAL